MLNILASAGDALFYLRMKIFRQFNHAFIWALGLFLGCVSQPHAASGVSSRNSKEVLVYFGTYTGGKSKGIYVARFNPANGKLGAPELAAETVSPSFLAVDPGRRFLYAANEIDKFNGKPGGAVAAFSIDPGTGKLVLLNQQPSGGGGPCHLVVDNTGGNVLVANYGGGSIEVIPVRSGGRLGEPTTFIQHRGTSLNPQRQEGPHAHFITTDAANRFVLACDLGLDKVLVYRFNAAHGSLVPNDPPGASVEPGSGPRHLALHANGRFAYVINEMACTLTAFAYDAEKGALKELQTVSTLPDGETAKPNYSTAEVEVHPNGKFLYGSNRGHNSIVVFAIDENTGKLAYLENVATQGKTPRSFGIDPTGKYLLAANQDSENVVVFHLDPATGRLTPTGQTIEVGAPVCVLFVPVGT